MMLTKGDLVRLPQCCKLHNSNDRAISVMELVEPKYALVLEAGEFQTTVLIENGKWLVYNKDIQLCGSSRVHKAS